MKLRFEKVSDVNDEYCHLDVFCEKHQTAFMDVSVGEDNRPRMNLYSQSAQISLNTQEWKMILEKAEEFTRKEIENEDSFKNF